MQGTLRDLLESGNKSDAVIIAFGDSSPGILPMQVTAEGLKSALEEGSGFVWELTLPKKDDGTPMPP